MTGYHDAEWHERSLTARERTVALAPGNRFKKCRTTRNCRFRSPGRLDDGLFSVRFKDAAGPCLDIHFHSLASRQEFDPPYRSPQEG
jgi:hypothetical protein